MPTAATPATFSFQFHTDDTLRQLYATDASEYQELPAAVAFPETPEHIRELILFAKDSDLSLIPRGAGTSLAGQVVGSGIVVDAGRHLNQILSIDAENRRVRVQPGDVRNELNHTLQPHGMLFGPETSTANRAMIGGMVGNNSCSSNSLMYGSTREHLIACKGYLSDGSEVTFEALSPEAFEAKCQGTNLEAAIYQKCRELLGDEAKVWELRRAGQGLVSNLPGDDKPREVCEDTAVDVTELADYIAEFDQLMRDKHGKQCVYYAHAGSDEPHTRPIFNLKTEAGLKTFRAVAEDVATLVKKYNGSLSGEHGDGHLRGEFIPFMAGEECFALMRQIKETFDPDNRFNPGKIIDTPPMDSDLRYGPNSPDPHYDTIFDFSANQGVLNAVENCNGSGDCRKGSLAGGTMCPSYMATRNEKDSTRARANSLRHALMHPIDADNPFNNEATKDVLDLSLSCKGCKSECPSNVDLAKLKAEFTQHYYDANGVPLRTKLIANFTRSSRFASKVPWLWNAVVSTAPLRKALNNIIGFHPDRTIPKLHSTTLEKWHGARGQKSAVRDQ